MPICGSRGFFAYNTVDLQAWGYITPKEVFEYFPGFEPDKETRENPPLGTTFKRVLYTDENGDPILDENEEEQFVWIETRSILPAKGLLVEFFYQTSDESDNASAAAVGGTSFGALGAGVGGGLIDAILNSTLLGGFTNLSSEFCWHLCSARTKVDMVFHIDQRIRDNNGIIELPGHIVSVLGAFKEPLELTEGQLARLGDSSTSPTSRRGITGDLTGDAIANVQEIDKGGTYKSVPYTSFFLQDGDKKPRFVFEEKNLLKQVLFDSRAKVYRADNQDIKANAYGPKTSLTTTNDISASSIQIDLDKFGEEDGNIYVTACLASKRVMREWNVHSAAIAETGDRLGGVTSKAIPVKSEIDTWHYQVVPTRVQKKPKLDNATEKKLDQKYLDSIKVGVNVFSTDQEALAEADRLWESVDDWRITEAFSYDMKQIYHADSRGILLVTVTDDGLPQSTLAFATVKCQVILTRQQIKDQVWFTKYLTDNNLLETVFDTTGIVTSEFFGVVFDVSEHVNTLVIDGKKIPYARTFATALKKINRQLGIGTPNLDIRLLDGSNQFDLSSAVFKPMDMSSTNQFAWAAAPCGAAGAFEFGSYYDSTNSFSKYSPNTSGAGTIISTPWLMRTPFYFGTFDRHTRVFVEKFLPHGLRYTPSAVYVLALPAPQASLSVDSTPFLDETFAFFENDAYSSISCYNFSSGVCQKFLGRLKYDPSGNHNRDEYDAEKFKYVSYSLAAGQLPAYSEGSFISNERTYICNAKPDSTGKIPTFNSIFTHGTWDIPSSISGMSHEIDDVDVSWLYRDIVLSYEVNQPLVSRADVNNSESLFVGGNNVGDNLLSIEFQSNNLVIDNIPLPTSLGKHEVFVDGRLYGGNPVKLHGKILPLVKWTGIKTVYTDRDLIEPFLISGRQTATAIDGRNRIHIFYTDQESNNISCAVSSDLGTSWWKFTDIIRLIEGEEAEDPYCICDKNSNTVYLFYKLNGRFLMVKPIQTDWFECDDQFLQYTPPQTFDENTDDNVGITQYTRGGKDLRRAISYFVQGDVKEEFLIRQVDIARTRLGEEPSSNAARKTARFLMVGDKDGIEGKHMDSSFDGTYAVYRDNRNKFRVLFNSDSGKMSWKTSGDLQHWYYDVKEVDIHKNLFDDTPETADTTADNPQVVYDSLSDFLYLFYFNQDSLFVRRFDNSLLYPADSTIEELTDDTGYYANDRIKKHVEIDRDSNNLPLFIVGTLDAQLIQKLQEDKDASLSNDPDTRATAVEFAYEDWDKFVSNFEVDINCKPVAYSLRNGMIRLLYRESDGLVFGATLNGMIPSLDVQRRYKV
jgi:hypothetical protein